MTDHEAWCYDLQAHDEHWIRQGFRCRGVTGEEAAVMAIVFDTGYAVETSLGRDDARRVIEALDQARGDA